MQDAQAVADYDHIRQVLSELVAYPQWTAYKLVPSKTRIGKTDKIPINPATGHNAKTDDSSTWSSFNKAVNRARSDILAGIGFIFCDTDPFVGIDLDGCVSNGNTEPWADEYDKLINSYSEYSQSLTGIHIIARGKLPTGGRRKKQIEMYDSGRFFAVTGYTRNVSSVQDRQSELEELHLRIFGATQHVSQNGKYPTSINPQSDSDILSRAMLDSKFVSLWYGKWQGDYASQSEADQALVNKLWFYTSADAILTDRLFRQSSLFRADKWDVKHFSNGNTYGQATIQKAATFVTDSFSANGMSHSVLASNPTNPTSFRVGDYVNLLSQGTITNSTPWRIDRIEYAPDGDAYAFFIETTSGWPCENCELVRRDYRLKFVSRKANKITLRRSNVRYVVTEERNTLTINAKIGNGTYEVVIEHGGDFTGAAQALAQSLAITAADAELDLQEIPDLITQNPRPATLATPMAKSLADFAPWANAKLSERSDRATKRSVGDAIRDWLASNKRLILDIDGDKPYMLSDGNIALPLMDEKGLSLKSALSDAGMNPTEAAFGWMLQDLQIAAYKHGTRIRLARWMRNDNSQVYISCGNNNYVVANSGGLQIKSNGEDGIVFAADSSIPAWDIRVTPVNPFSLVAFKPAIATSLESQDYTPDVQNGLLMSWLCALIAGVRPIPILVGLGPKNGGKSSLARAIMKVVLGAETDIATLSQDERDYWSAVIANPVFTLDNVDSGKFPTWFQDAIASTATGTRRAVRELYTTATVSSMAVRAALILTSRTASFARPDIAERILPIFTQEIDDSARVGERELYDSVVSNRDGILCYLAKSSANMLSWLNQVPASLPARFLDFAKIVWSYYAATNQAQGAIPTLNAWRSAQMLSVGSSDPLFAAILEFGDQCDMKQKKGLEIIKSLNDAGADLPLRQSSKVIARKLRELKSALLLAGWKTYEEKLPNTTVIFSVYR